LPGEAAILQSEPANTQMMNWNDLRYILAVQRGRSLTAAARLLGVDQTTVARRLAAIQEALGARLYQRMTDGKPQLTPSGERAALHAEMIETEIGALDLALAGADDVVCGTVRVTSVPIIINRILVPRAPTLLKRHPKLQLELVADARDLSLTRRETDLALRLGRPKIGGTKVTARRIGALRYEVYAAASCSAREARMLPWVTYDTAMAHLPQALEAVIAGLGRSLLPCVIADADSRLQKLGGKLRGSVLSRELWLLTHSELRTFGRIEAVVEWIEQIAPH
jgi:DNA-binding transcriptional LysR family regulator